MFTKLYNFLKTKLMIFKNNVEFWWFFKVIATLIVFLLIYIGLHVKFTGNAIYQLNSTDITNINLLFNSQSGFIKDSTMLDILVAAGDSTNKAKIKSVPADSLKELVLVYVFSKYPPLSKSDSLKTVKALMKFGTFTFPVIISQYPFKSDSFFWLTGGWIYLEIVFWSIFGLICNLLYNVSEAVRTKKFKENEQPVHVAKLFYTPFIVLVIYLAADMLSSDKSLSVPKYSEGALVFAFILGFFSRRSIELLDRLKEIILPGTKAGALEEQENQARINEIEQKENQ